MIKLGWLTFLSFYQLILPSWQVKGPQMTPTRAKKIFFYAKYTFKRMLWRISNIRKHISLESQVSSTMMVVLLLKGIKSLQASKYLAFNTGGLQNLVDRTQTKFK